MLVLRVCSIKQHSDVRSVKLTFALLVLVALFSEICLQDLAVYIAFVYHCRHSVVHVCVHIYIHMHQHQTLCIWKGRSMFSPQMQLSDSSLSVLKVRS